MKSFPLSGSLSSPVHAAHCNSLDGRPFASPSQPGGTQTAQAKQARCSGSVCLSKTIACCIIARSIIAASIHRVDWGSLRLALDIPGDCRHRFRLDLDGFPTNIQPDRPSSGSGLHKPETLTKCGPKEAAQKCCGEPRGTPARRTRKEGVSKHLPLTTRLQCRMSRVVFLALFSRSVSPGERADASCAH